MYRFCEQVQNRHCAFSIPSFIPTATGAAMIKGINHVGIVVSEIDDVLAFLRETFGAEEVKRAEFSHLKQISSIVQIGDGRFELMAPRAFR